MAVWLVTARSIITPPQRPKEEGWGNTCLVDGHHDEDGLELCNHFQNLAESLDLRLEPLDEIRVGVVRPRRLALPATAGD